MIRGTISIITYDKNGVKHEQKGYVYDGIGGKRSIRANEGAGKVIPVSKALQRVFDKSNEPMKCKSGRCGIKRKNQ